MNKGYSTIIIKDLFTSGSNYIIPLYQRAYSWEEKEIRQLIEDIYDYDEEKYYLGTLIVNKNNRGIFEVIDGQQRLTTLYLLFSLIDENLVDKNSFSFECREKSNNTVLNINNINSDKECDSSLLKGLEEINNILKEYDIRKILKKIENVLIYRIEVPKHTDLNRYFEIMNTRGEQLEQADILKANLMSYFEKSKSKSRDTFAKIWDACSNMSGYVQMNFKKDDREILFKSQWNELVNKPFESLESRYISEGKKFKIGVKDIIKDTFDVEIPNYADEEVERKRFDSFITFPYFLLHCLRIFVDCNEIVNIKDPNEAIYYDMLDDKKLLKEFNNVINNGMYKNGRIIDKNREKFSKDFINCLLKCRFLFDQYILKREYSLSNDKDGEWSIQHINTTGQQYNKKAYYSKTDFADLYEKNNKYINRNKDNIMIQSCLRVSYTSPKIMHWLTYILEIIYKGEYKNKDINKYLEKFAIDEVYDNFLKNGNFSLGTDTYRIVFNYLDYLIWKNNRDKYDFFNFEFRNSVEHFYPQNPEGLDKWDEVDKFGNLCLMQKEYNSKLSNRSPLEKKQAYLLKKVNEEEHEERYYEESNKSLKLLLMCDVLKSNDEWKSSDCDRHEQEMLNILQDNYNYYKAIL